MSDWHIKQQKSDRRIVGRLTTIREKINSLINHENPDIMDMRELCTMQTKIDEMMKKYSR